MKKKKTAKKKISWPIGILDIGSNSVRMVIFDQPEARKPFFNSKVNCCLGRNLDRTGRLYAEGKTKAFHAIRGFHDIAQAIGVKTFVAFATEAMREARDGKKFVRKIENVLGRKIHILSGEQEGRLAAQGVTSAMPAASGIVCDLGGGSLELAVIKKGKFAKAITLPLGALRLLNRKDRLNEYIDKHLQSIPKDYAAAGPLYVIGGSFRNMAGIHAKMAGKNGKGLNGYALDKKALSSLDKRLKRVSVHDIMVAYSVQHARAEVMHPVITLANRLINKLEAEKMIVSMNGIREGVLADLRKYGSLKSAGKRG